MPCAWFDEKFVGCFIKERNAMRKVDCLTHECMRDKAHFADIFNYYVYRGEEVLRPERLYEQDTTASRCHAPTYGIHRYRTEVSK